VKNASTKLLAIGLAAAFALSTSGCAVVMAAKQPDYKNVELFKPGTTRGQLLGEFGQPVSTETRKDGTKCDTFSFTQGYSGGAKAGRAVLHGVADVLTLGLWEIIGTPTEAVLNGNTVGYQACYGSDERVTEVTLLTKDDGKGLRNPDGEVVTPPTPQEGSVVTTPAQPQVQTSVTGSPQQKLQELKGLKQEGLITDTEYKQKRKAILDQM
jgi:hypothetical protein